MKYLWPLFLTAFTAFGAPEVSPWQNSWSYGDSPDGNLLEIKNVTDQGFDFAITGTAGSNVGQLDGKATFESGGKKAQARIEKCQVTFGLKGKALSVVTENCSEGLASGVDFDGEYHSGSAVYEAGFDCGKAQSAVEKRICGNRWLAAADKELSTAFMTAEKAAKGEAKKSLKTAQRNWLADRNKACEAAKEDSCLADRYLARLGELRALARKRSGNQLLVFEDYLKSSYDECRDALWNDPGFRLMVFRRLGEERTEMFFAHTIYFAEDTKKSTKGMTEIALFSNVRGIPQTAATLLNKQGDLWIGYQTTEGGRWRQLVFGPTGSKPVPPTISEWIADTKQATALPAKIEHVF